MKYLSQLIALLVSYWFTSCSTDGSIWNEPELPTVSSSVNENSYERSDTDENYYNSQSTVSEVVRDPAFDGFGHLLFPVDRNISPSMTLAQISTSGVYMWYPYIRTDKTVEVINYLHSQAVAGHRIFYNIYTTEQIAADPSKADTGLFVFNGDSGQPFAITNAGGGFAYVGAMHDSFPHSLEICRAGYTAFALIYRPDDPYNDLAHAIAFIHDHAAELGVAKENYSLWGGSAGARMAATLGNRNNLDQLSGRSDLPQAAAVIMQYTGYSAVSPADPPTYSCVGSVDGIASWRIMQTRLWQLSAMGIPTEFHVYEGLGHGFGIGTGTVAEGWINDAIHFWEINMHKDTNSGLPHIPVI